MKTLCISAIRMYQGTLSYVLGPCCRFYPSCSQYTIDAIELHGVLQGAWLSCKRIAKCHPFHLGGVDEVPERDVEPLGHA